jgi:hypothetical protein
MIEKTENKQKNQNQKKLTSQTKVWLGSASGPPKFFRAISGSYSASKSKDLEGRRKGNHPPNRGGHRTSNEQRRRTSPNLKA